MAHRLIGSRLSAYHREYLAQDRARRLPDSSVALDAMLRHAVATVPYYREIAGIDADHIGDPVAFLSSLPSLTKERIRAAGERMLSSSGDRSTWYENATGGSTGEPLKLIQDADHRARIVAIQELYSTWAGGGLGRPEVF